MLQGEVSGLQPMHTDDLIALGWSEASAAVIPWISRPGPWIIEGVAVPRALRKWFAANPTGKPAPDLTLRTTTTTGEAIEIEAALASRFAELTTPSRSEWYGDRAAYGTAARWFNEHGMLTRDARGGYKWREDYTDPTLRASFVRQFVDPGARSRARS
jgi:hypothetical protein